MSIHYTSLLIAVAFSGAAVGLAVLTSWMNTRKERYLVLGVIGLGLMSVGVGLMTLRNGHYNFFTLTAPFALLLAGMSFAYSGALTYYGRPAFRTPFLLGAAGIAAIAACFGAGLLGLGNIVLNALGGLILILSGREYLRGNDEMRAAATANGALYVTTGLSFLLCAIFVASSGEWIAYPAIDNWADNLNAVMSLGGISGIGALTLSMHFARTARRHRSEANTDVLTSVLNRRALFERFPENTSTSGMAVLVLDLDHFKQVNDIHGHAQGDLTLRRFADVLKASVEPGHVVARIGGEEFCVVMPNATRSTAKSTAERIRNCLGEAALPGGQADTILTVSVGLATGGADEPFHSVLSRADDALYKAKRSGRDTVRLAEHIQAA